MLIQINKIIKIFRLFKLQNLEITIKHVRSTNRRFFKFNYLEITIKHVKRLLSLMDDTCVSTMKTLEHSL